MSFKFKREDSYFQDFVLGAITLIAEYDSWAMFKKDKFLWRWRIIWSSSLSQFLRALFGEKHELSVNERQAKILKDAFEYSFKKDVFQEAKEILNQKGSEEALKFLGEKFVLFRLLEKVSGKGLLGY